MKNKENTSPSEVKHPGVLIKAEIEAARPGLMQKEIAAELGITPAVLNDLYFGRRNLIPDIAIIFEKVFKIPADYWMNFQTQYEIDQARKKERTIIRLENIEIWNVIKEYVPVYYFIKLGYLKGNHITDLPKIKKIYSINSVDDFVSLFKQNKFAKYIKPKNPKINKIKLHAWTSLAEYKSGIQTVNEFNFDNLKPLYTELNKIFSDNINTIEKVKSILEQYGIKFVMIQDPGETPIAGYSFWSDKNPAVALNSKERRLYEFAFSLMYELAHIEKHIFKKKGLSFLDIRETGKKDKYETEANSYAREILIPKDCWDEILCNNKSLNYEKIIQISEKYKINSDILLVHVYNELKTYRFKTKIGKKLK